MNNKIIGISTALVIGLSTPALAQDDLVGFLDGISGMAPQMGGAVSFSERNVGADNSVEYRGLFISAPGGDLVITADWLKAVPSASTPGQVTFTLSPNASVSINDSSFPAPIVVNIANNGLTVTVDGLTSGQSAETLNYSVSANSLSVTTEVGGNPFLRAFDMALTDFAVDFSISPGTMLITNSASIGSADYTYDFISPEQDEIKGTGTFANFEYALSFFGVDDDRFTEYMTGELNAFFELAMGKSTGSASISNRDIDMAYSGVSEGLSLTATMQDGRLTVSEVVDATVYSFTKLNIEGLPVPPFDFSIDGLEFAVSFPFSTGGGFENASISLALRNLAVSETLYSMFDPGQVISRDPVNIVVDVSANVKSSIDWSDPQSAFMSGNPADFGEVQDMMINELNVSAAGVMLAVTGSAMIDSSMGIPLPTGTATVMVSGIQALANGLVELGFIPPEQVGMAMGMMLAFARPGDMADEFISDIVFSPEGITANGVPLPF